MGRPSKLVSHRFELAEAPDAVFDYAYRHGWTDGLPIIPPTQRRVVNMMKYVERSPADVIAEIPPAMGEATVEKIAINAVMAGCLPEYLPVVIAAVEAVVEKQFNLAGIQATTHPVGPILVINGPIRTELEINSGANCFGQGWRSNATIGRALRLILLNVGGGVPGLVDKSTQGMPGKYTFCFGENEEESPWQPLHVDRGFDASESVVSVIGGASPMNLSCSSRGATCFLTLQANAMSVMATNNMYHGGEPLIVMCPQHAQVIAQTGFSKERAKQFLFEHSGAPLERFPEERRALPLADGHVVDGIVYPAKRPEDVMVVVAGGPGGLHSSYITTFGDTRAVSKRIVGPVGGVFVQ